jgi:hypothetical protein
MIAASATYLRLFTSGDLPQSDLPQKIDIYATGIKLG